MNDTGPLKINRTVFNAVLAPPIVAAVLGLAGWGWWLHAGHAEQEKHIAKHDGEIATLQWASDHVLAKLDEILRELQGKLIASLRKVCRRLAVAVQSALLQGRRAARHVRCNSHPLANRIGRSQGHRAASSAGL